jgi:hypothetical protein
MAVLIRVPQTLVKKRILRVAHPSPQHHGSNSHFRLVRCHHITRVLNRTPPRAVHSITPNARD